MNLNQHIQSAILSNLTEPSNRRIGVELECFFYDAECNRIPVNPTNQFSATDFLKEIQAQSKNENSQASYSLEPGGQLEWSSSPLTNLHDIHKEMEAHFSRAKDIVKNNNLIHLDFALEPMYSPDDIDLIQENKYHLMDKRFRKVGKLGPWMMRNTTSIQVNLDIATKAEAEQMAWLADVLEPFCALLFANSPFMNGKPTGPKNMRYDIWDDTDSVRCGNLLDHGIFSSNGLLEKFANHVLKTPAIFVYGDQGLAEEFSGTLGSYLEKMSQKDELKNEHIMSALHQIFTHARFKNVLEVRGADRPPRGFEMAPIAFWLGLLSEKVTQDELTKLFDPLGIDDRKLFNKNARTLDLNQEAPKNQLMGEWLKKICNIALKGLDERSKNLNIENERKYLEPYLKIFFNYGFISLHRQKIFLQSGLDLKTFLFKQND
ncbi:MAG: hypothetical protein HN657_05685 [Candidatus Marinimicrobia bacterium]|nr:hypothetical protein [Candidatus Neomarinimicrobiota bacterium]MBT3495574.1 hypothetical protein [Candidatus Neomarinimicrobiota bacterium]MBT4144373.1 hypothetical protein [Candidatus Neomarinimicrobiota bacterium]MBT4177441.1 hypothetical protein [Candidatus Neomarinimicrobiota bacterium]MBT4593316.1 hypothetical protein [Candidatus Neomarinimicrobiota bacterium]